MTFALILCVFLIPMNANAADQDIYPVPIDDRVESRNKIKSYNKSYLTKTDNGYMRVFYDRRGTEKPYIGIEYYDRSFHLLNRKKLKMEMDMWGGFYEGKDAFYIVEGTCNVDLKKNFEVIRVIKYSKSWKRLGAAGIYTDKYVICEPFANSGCAITDNAGQLYIATGHTREGHQGFLMLQVDEEKLTGEVIKTDLLHSYEQFIQRDGNVLYYLEQSDGDRCAKLTRRGKNSSYSIERFPVFKYGGKHTSSYRIPFYATCDDLSISDKNILTLGTSIDQTKYYNKKHPPANLYLTVTPKDTFTKASTSTIWLTDIKNKNLRFEGTQMIKVSPRRFLVIWELENTETAKRTTYYQLYDENGKAVGKRHSTSVSLSRCHPITEGNKVIYCLSYGKKVTFVTINAKTGSLKKVNYRAAGESATWKLTGKTLTITGKGPIEGGSEVSIWPAECMKAKKIVISNGITRIPQSCFYDFKAVLEVTIGSGVKFIGINAFESDLLKKITIYSKNAKIESSSLGSNPNVLYECYKGSTTEKYANKYAKESSLGSHPRIHYIYLVNKNGKWYYPKNGKNVTGWAKLNKQYYYFDKKGVMQTGWKTIKGKRYYFDKDGVMQIGWTTINKKKYYFKLTGAVGTIGVMAVNEFVEGKYLGKNGVKSAKAICTWKHLGDKRWMFSNSSGWYAKGTTYTIDGEKFTFDSSGYYYSK